MTTIKPNLHRLLWRDRVGWDPGAIPEDKTRPRFIYPGFLDTEVRAMARGKPTPENKTEEVRAILMLNPDATGKEISKITKLPVRTAQDLKNKVIDAEPDTFASIRARKKEEFIVEAWEVVKKALLAADKKIELFLSDPESLAKANVRDIAVALGTIYDKQALASGEPTTITERKEPVTKLVEEYEDKLKKLKSIIGEKTV